MDVSNEAEAGHATERAKAAGGMVLLTLASAQFLMTLDSSVMNVSIATVAKDVGTTVTGIQTAITFYTLVMASLMITGGKLGQILGRKRAFAIGCVIYGIGFGCLFAAIVVMVALLDSGAGPEITTWPMLLAGLGIGALASQLGSVTVSSVPDEQSGEVGGVQNTLTNLGASIGTALAGAVLISALTASFLTGIQNNPGVPKDLAAQAQVELAGGIPFMSDKDLQAQLGKAGVPAKTADAIVEENANARIAGLRASLSVLAVIALIALFFSRRIPTKQPSAAAASEPAA